MLRSSKRLAIFLVLILVFFEADSSLASRKTRDGPSSNNGVYCGPVPMDFCLYIDFLDQPYGSIPLSGSGLSGTLTMYRVSIFDTSYTYVSVGQTMIVVALAAPPSGSNISSQAITAVGISPPSGTPLVNPWYAVTTAFTGAPYFYPDPFNGMGMVSPAATPVTFADRTTNLWTVDPSAVANSVALLVDGFPDSSYPVNVSYSADYSTQTPSIDPTLLPISTPYGDGIIGGYGNGLLNIAAANIAVVVHVAYVDGSTKDITLGGLPLGGGLEPCPTTVSGVTCHSASSQPIPLTNTNYSEVTRLDNAPISSQQLSNSNPPAACSDFITSGAAGLARSWTYQLKSATNQVATIDTTGSHFDTVLIVTSPDDANFSPQCNDDYSDQDVQASLSNLAFSAGKTYNIVAGEYPAYLSSDPVLDFSISFAAEGTSTTVSCSPLSTNVDQTVSCSATVSDTTNPSHVPAGIVEFAITPVGASNVSPVVLLAPLTGANAAVSFNSLTGGSYLVTSTFAPFVPESSQFAQSSSPLNSSATLTVSSVASTTSLTSSAAPEGNSVTPVTLTATVSNSAAPDFSPGGVIDFVGTNLYNGSPYGAFVPVVNGQATFTVVPQAEYSFEATYYGDTSFSSSGTSTPITINIVPPLATTTSASVSSATAVAGSSINLTATVSVTNGPGPPGIPTPTGTFTLLDGTTQMGPPIAIGYPASFTISNIAAGAHSYTVRYSGDSSNAASTSAPLGVMVSKDGSGVSLTSSSSSTTVGSPVTFTAIVSNTSGTSLLPTGIVTFLDGSSTLGTATVNEGSATLTTSMASTILGSFLITAQYGGDTNFSTSTSPALKLTVVPPPLAIATTSLANGWANSSYTAMLSATGGTPPYIWTLRTGSLPAGLSLNTKTGVISGTPTTVGTSLFTVEVDDAEAVPVRATTNLSITITPKIGLSVTPSGETGLTQTFTMVYSDVAGTSDIKIANFLFNTAVSTQKTCLVQFLPSVGKMYLLNDAGNAYLTPAVAPGSSASEANSQCTISGAGSSATTSGNNLTLQVAITFTSTFSGQKNIYLAASNPTLSTGWVEEGTWTPAAGSPFPSVVSVGPTSGKGLSETFSFTYADAGGASSLTVVNLLFNATLTASNGCLVQYIPRIKKMYLLNDAGNAYLTTAVEPGSSASVANSQCTIFGAGSSATTSGNNLTLQVAITFAATFSGQKNTYSAAADSVANTGWVKEGTWTPAAGASPFPSVVSVSPTSGRGLSETFTFTYADAGGASNLTVVNLLVNATLTTPNGCLVQYIPAIKKMYLLNDAGNAYLTTAVEPGSSASVANSQCTIFGAGSSATTSGNNLTLQVAITFAATFSGQKNTYSGAADSGANTGWVKGGTWIPSGQASIPSVVSIAPDSGTGLTQTFTFTYTDTGGAANLSVLDFLFNSVIATPNACLVQYIPANKKMYLLNDAGNAYLSTTVTPGSSASVSNDQCTLSGSDSSVITSGNNITLTVGIVFTSSFTGQKNIYFGAADPGANTGWTKGGTWTP